MIRPSLGIFMALGLLSSGCAHPVRNVVPAPARVTVAGLGAPAWALIKQRLLGRWVLPGKNGVFVVSYKLISGESALVEEWGAGTPHETETIFFPDLADLLLTHYCAQGNQPRLRVTEVSSESVVFKFVDVTNHLPEQSMLVERRLHFANDAFDDTEIYRAPDGSNETTTYHFSREPH
jgi:hypothetical protein